MSFSGSAAPWNRMRCPVGTWVSSMGEMRARNHFSSPSAAIAHVICWNTESRSVLENWRTTTAFAPGFASVTGTMASDMNEPLVAPAVGLTVLVEALALEQPRCGGPVLVAWQRGSW